MFQYRDRIGENFISLPNQHETSYSAIMYQFHTSKDSNIKLEFWRSIHSVPKCWHHHKDFVFIFCLIWFIVLSSAVVHKAHLISSRSLADVFFNFSTSRPPERIGTRIAGVKFVLNSYVAFTSVSLYNGVNRDAYIILFMLSPFFLLRSVGGFSKSVRG